MGRGGVEPEPTEAYQNLFPDLYSMFFPKSFLKAAQYVFPKSILKIKVI
jgi:hypothetical protein